MLCVPFTGTTKTHKPGSLENNPSDIISDYKSISSFENSVTDITNLSNGLSPSHQVGTTSYLFSTCQNPNTDNLFIHNQVNLPPHLTSNTFKTNNPLPNSTVSLDSSILHSSAKYHTNAPVFTAAPNFYDSKNFNSSYPSINSILSLENAIPCSVDSFDTLEITDFSSLLHFPSSPVNTPSTSVSHNLFSCDSRTLVNPTKLSDSHLPVSAINRPAFEISCGDFPVMSSEASAPLKTQNNYEHLYQNSDFGSSFSDQTPGSFLHRKAGAMSPIQECENLLFPDRNVSSFGCISEFLFDADLSSTLLANYNNSTPATANQSSTLLGTSDIDLTYTPLEELDLFANPSVLENQEDLDLFSIPNLNSFDDIFSLLKFLPSTDQNENLYHKQRPVDFHDSFTSVPSSLDSLCVVASSLSTSHQFTSDVSFDGSNNNVSSHPLSPNSAIPPNAPLLSSFPQNKRKADDVLESGSESKPSKKPASANPSSSKRFQCSTLQSNESHVHPSTVQTFSKEVWMSRLQKDIHSQT
ncbi:hypothetical protein BB559_000071 [Furculomyces boomerangus]|uniref:Uncharacterized protein n=1 Tax=Furculomyces boomerangus TaxID=61424 RepID=A0A2T9Z6C9_9FUNG|nr:hypothetical protein BB559_000071 [Furculomyces boomerangus]